MKALIWVPLFLLLAACQPSAGPTATGDRSTAGSLNPPTSETPPSSSTPTARPRSTSSPSSTPTQPTTPTSLPTATPSLVPEPGASRFIYESRGGIVLARSDGTLRTPIVAGAVPFGSGSSSPLVQAVAPLTGSLTYAASRSEGTGYQLWIYQPDSEPRVVVTLEGESRYIEWTAITRNGSRIAYSVLEWTERDAEEWYEQLWVVNADGSGNRLVADRTGEAIVDPGPFRLAPIAWSRDQSKIYLVTNSDSEATPTGLYVADVATGMISKANTPEETMWRAVFSPDGSRVAYYSFQWIPVEGFRPEPGPPYAIKVTQLSNGNTSVVWQSEAEPATDPIWSPDGSSLAFSRNRNTIARITLVNGSVTTVIEGGPEEWLRPRGWLTDGRIVYTSGESSDRLMTVRVDGSDPRLIGEVTRVSVLGEVP